MTGQVGSGWVRKYENVRVRSKNPGGIQHQPDEKGLQAMCKFCGVVRQEKVDFLYTAALGWKFPTCVNQAIHNYKQTIITSKLIPSVILAVHCLEINFKLGKWCL